MIIRDKPKDLINYIKVDSNTSYILSQNGFFPKYIDNDYIYYVKTNSLIEYMKGENLIEK
jgi:hypothetical protein